MVGLLLNNRLTLQVSDIIYRYLNFESINLERSQIFDIQLGQQFFFLQNTHVENQMKTNAQTNFSTVSLLYCIYVLIHVTNMISRTT